MSCCIRVEENASTCSLGYEFKSKDPGPYLWMSNLLVKYSAIDQVRLCATTPQRSAQDLKKDSSAYGTTERPWLVAQGNTNYQGGYAINGWFYSKDIYNIDAAGLRKHFTGEASIQNVATTPLFCDAIWVDCWPEPNDVPARNLYNGDQFAGGGISRVAIPRHAFPPKQAPRNFNPKDNLPGAINLTFTDDHVEAVKLEKLWNLTWHTDWVPPAKRPGS